jgi:hypothetical protein
LYLGALSSVPEGLYNRPWTLDLYTLRQRQEESEALLSSHDSGGVPASTFADAVDSSTDSESVGETNGSDRGAEQADGIDGEAQHSTGR